MSAPRHLSVPVNEPVLGENEKRYLIECIETGWISAEGPFVERFEEAFSQRVGRQHGVAVANGSAALDVAIAALRLGPGDEVILPTFTIISCATAVTRAGATPVVVDCDPVTFNMTANLVEAAITPRTRAIMAVHLYGHPVDIDPILKLAERHGLAIIEDAAEMHGQMYKDRPCGSFGHLSTFSFYPNKLVTCGEGGMIVTDDAALAARCRSLRNLCFENNRRFVHEEIGWNYRLTNMQAAVGLAQLERLDEVILKKRHIGATYTRLLAGTPGIQLSPAETSYSRNLYWVFPLVLEDWVEMDAHAAMAALGSQAIGTRPFFWPMHEQPVFRSRGLFEGISCPVAERIARRGFYVPSGVALTDPQMERVAEVVRAVIR